MTQLERLARPFPASMIQQKPGKFAASFVSHSEVVQKMLATVGPHDFAVTEIVRGPDGKIEGCLATMTAEIDGRVTSITEVGDCERPDNWPTDGARLKDAASDAYKRCAMRLGVGLHLWAGERYALDRQLTKLAEHEVPEPPSVPESAESVSAGAVASEGLAGGAA